MDKRRNFPIRRFKAFLSNVSTILLTLRCQKTKKKYYSVKCTYSIHQFKYTSNFVRHITFERFYTDTTDTLNS